MGKTCYLWPYNREALIVGLSTHDNNYNFKGIPKSNSFNDTRNWERDAMYLDNKWRNRAVDFGTIDVILSARMLIGTVRNRNGVINKTYSREVRKFPLQAVFTSRPSKMGT